MNIMLISRFFDLNEPDLVGFNSRIVVFTVNVKDFLSGKKMNQVHFLNEAIVVKFECEVMKFCSFPVNPETYVKWKFMCQECHL